MSIRDVVILLGVGLTAAVQSAQAQAKGTSADLEEVLYMQNPHPAGPDGGYHVVWIPQPLQRVCMGKTAQQCSEIDYCIRTTSRNVPVCQKLSLDYARLPVYPSDMRPRRLISMIIFPKAPVPGLDKIKSFVASKPSSAFDHLSQDTRIRAKIRFSRSTDDDDFEILEFLSVTP